MAAERAARPSTEQMTPGEFWRVVKSEGITFFSGVPCSLLESIMEHCFRDPEVTYVTAPREDAALGVAGGASLAGRGAGILIQNSGLGNVINGLTSFNLLYRVPVFMVISWRGYEGRDAPEHLMMGAKTLDLLQEMEIPTCVLGDEGADGPEGKIRALAAIMRERRVPVALVIRPGVVLP